MTDMDKAIKEARAAVMPFESWERLPGESGPAYAAFCAYRDLGLERNIRKAIRKVVEGQFHKVEMADAKVEAAIVRKYRMWRNWCLRTAGRRGRRTMTATWKN
jgi:hypothetical protein